MIRPSSLMPFAVLVASGSIAGAEPRHSGSVVYAVADRLYLDAGTRDGIAAAQVVQLRRRGEPAGTCTVQTVSDAKATCLGNGRVGDTFAVSPPQHPAIAARRPPAPLPAQIVQQRRNLIAGAAFEKVPFQEPPGGVISTRGATVAVRHLTWAATGSTPWQQERADVALHGFPLGKGFSVDLDLSARRWSRRSDPISFRPDDQAQLYVWEASLSRRAAEGGLALSLGRVRTRSAPGQTLLDGAQAGIRSAGGSEAGVFGGVVPDAVTLSPSLEHGTFGAYWSARYTGDPDSVWRFVRHEARVAFVNTAELGRRLEGEALVDFRLTRAITAAVDARFGLGDHQAPNALDAVRVDGMIRPADTLSLIGSFRYEALNVPGLDGPGNVLSGGAARHAQLSAAWEPSPAVRFSVVSGLSTDLTLHQSRQWIGPEIGFPQLFSSHLIASAGYFEERGWEPGRSAWAQVIVRTQRAFRLLTRFSWYRTRNAAPVDLDELGVSAALEAQLGPYVALRLSALGRTALNGERTPWGGATTQTGVLDASLAGQF